MNAPNFDRALRELEILEAKEARAMQDEPKSDEREIRASRDRAPTVRGPVRPGIEATVTVPCHDVPVRVFAPCEPDARSVTFRGVACPTCGKSYSIGIDASDGLTLAEAFAPEPLPVGLPRIVNVAISPNDLRAEVMLAPKSDAPRPAWFPHVNELDHTAALAWKNAKADTPHRAVVDAVTSLILSRVPHGERERHEAFMPCEPYRPMPRARRDDESPVGYFERAPSSVDRTCAIVEAAEKLHAHLSNARHAIDSTSEGDVARELLSDLGRALALPASQVDDRASGWSRACALLAAKYDDIATRMPQRDDAAWALRNAAEIARDNAATFPTAPEWTREPPKEPGWYWVRLRIDEQAWTGEAVAMEWSPGDWTVDRSGAVREFFPIPIERPTR